MTNPGPAAEEGGDGTGAGEPREPLPVGGGGAGAVETRAAYPSYALSAEAQPRGVVSGPAGGGGTADVGDALRALPAGRRLAARKDPVVAACVVAELLVRALALVSDLDEERPQDTYGERYAELARHFANARNFKLDAVPTRDLTTVLALASVFARALVHDLDRADRPRDLALDIARVLDEAARARSSARVRDLGPDARRLAAELAVDAARRLGLPAAEGLVAALLDGALDDFTGADLTGVNPTDPALIGIQWSEGTRWPPGTDVEALRRRFRRWW